VQQLSTIALPRRFSLPMQEIWLLQSRFSSRQRKRVFRTLTHPRFRAAFDFLSLRQVASAEHAADVEFWREAQAQSGRELESSLDAMHSEEGDDESGAPRKRRRRRRPVPGRCSWRVSDDPCLDRPRRQPWRRGRHRRRGDCRAGRPARDPPAPGLAAVRNAGLGQ
jgi:hypothetical protein